MPRCSVSLQITTLFLPDYSTDVGTKQLPHKYSQMDSAITELKRQSKEH